MVKKLNKKAAIEMSLNLIIMLIIGMVVLGLVIGFVNSLVNKGTESFDKQLGDNEKLKLEELKNCPDNLCVNPSPSISVKKGGKTNIFLKVRAYGEEITCGAGILDCTVLTTIVLDEEGADVTGSNLLYLTGPGFNAIGGGDDVQMYTLKTSEEVVVGTYYLTLTLYDETTKTITVQVE